ncbi:MAG: hypothetical protein ACKOA8_18935, partial [Deltaproteobacteria bacterium]
MVRVDVNESSGKNKVRVGLKTGLVIEFAVLTFILTMAVSISFADLKDESEFQIVSGQEFSCVLIRKIASAEVKCWFIGGKDTIDKRTWDVTKVPLLKNPRFLSANYQTVCSLDDEGVKCWGRNDFLSTRPEWSSFRPKEKFPPRPQLNQPTMLAVGYEFACALDRS